MPLLVKMIIHLSPIEISNIFKNLLFLLNNLFRFRLYVAHSLAIAFCVFELIPLILGITSITFARSFLAIILHLSAAIGLAFFLLQYQCALRIWPIFAICSCVPFLIECTAAIYKTIRQRV
jgi:hypothetical protein